MASLQQLEQALIGADKAGDTDAASKLAEVIKRERARIAETPSEDVLSQIPGMEESVVPVPGTEPAPPPEPTLGEMVVGAGETALSTGTGLTTGAAMGVGGFLNALAREVVAGQYGSPAAAERIQQATMEGMQAGTYEPRTEAGRRGVEMVGALMEQATPVLPMTAELGAIGTAVKGARPMMGAATRTVAAPVKRAVTTVREKLPMGKPVEGAPAAGAQSVGVAEVEAATLRQARAEELPIPMKLTKGMREKGEQRKWEVETSKLDVVGEPLRKREAELRTQLEQNLDTFIDRTGAKASDVRGIGEVVDEALNKRMMKDKNKINVLYKKAEKAGEMESPIALDKLAAHLTETIPEAEVANVLKVAVSKAKQLGALEEGAGGKFIARPIPLKNVELLRRAIGDATNIEKPNIRQSAIMKSLIDEDTASLGGNLYKEARAARAQFAKDYENIGLVKQLLNTKRGTDDRIIALEDVLDRSIIRPSTSYDTVVQLQRLLKSSGKEGRQAWRELQGGTLAYIRGMVLKSVQKDSAGSRVMSPTQLDKVIQQLDKSGKLDLLFGKKQSQQIRSLNEVAQDILTLPLGTNTSNTASSLANLFMQIPTGKFSMEILKRTLSFLKDRKLRAKVQEALR